MKSAKIGFVLATVALAAQPGIAAEETAKAQPRVIQAAADAPLAPMSLSAIFAAAAAVDQNAVTQPARGMLVGIPSVEVLVARVENGRIVTACVSSESAAREFLKPKNDVVPVEGGK
jgi:hypothetical protein